MSSVLVLKTHESVELRLYPSLGLRSSKKAAQVCKVYYHSSGFMSMGRLLMLVSWGCTSLMALISISGDTGCRFEELARAAAHDFKSQLITEARFQEIIVAEFGAGREIPARSRLPLLTSVLARLAHQHPLLTTLPR